MVLVILVQNARNIDSKEEYYFMPLKMPRGEYLDRDI